MRTYLRRAANLQVLVKQSDWVAANKIFKDLRGLFTNLGGAAGDDPMSLHDNTAKRKNFNDEFWVRVYLFIYSFINHDS